ncbi:unnamed protein product [Cylicostephanus goldi]|uniref:Uncharacterized protein n=1 Tax=Cylicostephanus goldi TaxID=71465 RepID=A0A3P7MJR6_CYLGO|nr:unnamed protein product [Cylicostephanus goldi]
MKIEGGRASDETVSEVLPEELRLDATPPLPIPTATSARSKTLRDPLDVCPAFQLTLMFDVKYDNRSTCMQYSKPEK